METRKMFRLKLTRIASLLGTEQLERLKYLCQDDIPHGDRERIKTPEQLFLELEQRQVITPNSLQFLINCLENIGRKDLAEDLRNFEHLKRAEAGADSVAANSLDSLHQEAESYNIKGRVAFKEGRYENACQQYTAALECLPESQGRDERAKYLCNRAACYVNQRKFKEACTDCEKALLLDPHHTKARYRLAQALQGQGKLAKAFEEVTVLRQRNPENHGIIQLWDSLKKEVEEAKDTAMKKRRDGHANFLKSHYDEAIRNFSEGILLLPNVDMYAKDRMQFYWKRAECYLKKNELENAKRDCEEANRLVPEDPMVLNTMMQVLERLKEYNDCYAVCNRLIKMKVKETEAEDTTSRILPKMLSQDGESRKQVEANAQLPEMANSKKSKKKKKGSRKKKNRGEGNSEEKEVSPREGDELSPVCSSTTQSSLPVKEDIGKDVAAEDTLPGAEFTQERKDAERKAEDEGLDLAVNKAISCEMHRKTAQEDSQMMENVPFAPFATETEDRTVLDKAESGCMHVISKDSGLPSSTDIAGSLESDVVTMSREEDSQVLEAVPYVPGQDRTAEENVVLDKAEARHIPLTDSSTAQLCDSYPRRILLICDRWSCWHRSESRLNRQLCRSFARNGEVHVACLVLDATDQETSVAARDGVNLIKATSQPGIAQADKELLRLHSDFPFNADLVVGHGMVSGTAAAIQAKRMNCRRLHIIHNLPGDCQGCNEDLQEETEKELALGADFVAGVGPLVVEQWEGILNRRVFTIIPGLPNIAPRNQIMTPQCRSLILGDMNNPVVGGLKLVTDAIATCAKKNSIHLTVVGTDREKVCALTEEVNSGLRTFRIKVKPLDVSQETVGVEIRGVSLVMIPFPSDGFGMVALDAIAAKVPILISSKSGIAKFLQKEFGTQFLKLVCSAGYDADCVEAWSDAIDEIFNDRKEAFVLAESLRDKWNSNYTWDSTSDKLFKHLSDSGLFTVLSPSAYKQYTLPSQCSDSALRFVQEEVDLLNKRRKHVLFLSPENVNESPFIHYFAQVPWAAVFDFDVKSVKTGYLASCESFCESMGMKICRILPPTSPDEDRKKFLVGSLTGIPWVLLEGIPESRRSIKGNLEWMRDFFVALGKNYQVPITFTVLWKSSKETDALCKSLSKILTVVQGSSLYNQVKLVAVSTGDNVSPHLEDIAEDWGVEVQRISLEDVCNALCQCVSSSPFIHGDQDFSLPVADPDEPQNVTFKELPPSSRWIVAEMEVLFQSVGSTPQFETDDACHFYRGGLISWYALQMGYAIERTNWKALKDKVDELLLGTGTLKLKMPHQRGAGGSTSARKILFDYHERFPCVSLKSVCHPEVAQAIKVVAEFCKLPVVILADCKQLQGDEFDIDTLYNILSNERIPCVVLEVFHQSQKKGMDSSCGSGRTERTVPFRLADILESQEREQFVRVYSEQRKNKLSSLNSLLHNGQRQLQIPFFYALTTFEDGFTGLEPFVRECLRNLDSRQEKILLFFAMAYHYGHNSLSANEFAVLLQAPRREVISLERVLTELSMELLLEEDDKWRPRHDLIAFEMIRQLLTMTRSKGLPPVHPDNWQNQLAEKALEFFEYMSESVVSDVLVSRNTDDSSHQYISFSQLITDVSIEEDAIKLFEKAISLFPDNPFFKVHLGRYYSIKKKLTGISMAIKYTDEGIFCSQNYSRLVRGQFAQMKGVVYSRQVNYLVEQGAELETIIEMAVEGVENFRRAVSIAPDFVDGYIPEVRMMCKVFEYIERKTGNFRAYVKSNSAHPFIIDAISNTSNILECVPDSDQYAIWRARLACLGHKDFSPAQVHETLELLYHLQTSGRASRGSINRQIVVMRMDMCREQGHPLSSVASELIELLNEALRFDPNVEQTMRLWVRLAPFIPVSLPESESKIFNWCSNEKSVRSYLYKYIIAFLHLLEGGSFSYSEIMKSAKDDLVSAIRAINRPDVGRCRHPDRPVVWLGKQGKGMGHLVYLDDKIPDFKYVRMKRFMGGKYTKQLRPLTGLIVKTGLKVGTIRINGELEVSFRADLCETQLTSSHFINRKVQFFLAFTFFGTDAYNVRLVAE